MERASTKCVRVRKTLKRMIFFFFYRTTVKQSINLLHVKSLNRQKLVLAEKHQPPNYCPTDCLYLVWFFWVQLLLHCHMLNMSLSFCGICHKWKPYNILSRIFPHEIVGKMILQTFPKWKTPWDGNRRRRHRPLPTTRPMSLFTRTMPGHSFQAFLIITIK